MLQIAYKTVAQTRTVATFTSCRHTPARAVWFRRQERLRRASARPKLGCSRRSRCETSAVSSLFQTQTRSNSNGTGLATEKMEVTIADLQQMCRDALKALGYDDQQSTTISEVRMNPYCRGTNLKCSNSSELHFAGVVVCPAAQQQQQHGQSHHRRLGQAARRSFTKDTAAKQHFCCHQWASLCWHHCHEGSTAAHCREGKECWLWHCRHKPHSYRQRSYWVNPSQRQHTVATVFTMHVTVHISFCRVCSVSGALHLTLLHCTYTHI